MIIDSHCHVGLYPEHFPESFATPMMASVGLPPAAIETHIATLLQAMDAGGIDRAVLLAFDAQRTLGARVPNEYVAMICQEHPDRFIGFCSVDAGVTGVGRAARDALEQLGMQGIKIAPAYVHLSPADQRWYEVYEVAQALRCPVLLHTGFTPARDAAQQFFAPGLVEQVARDFPELRLILAHLGTPWVQQCLSLLERYPHVYADLSIFGWYQPVTRVAQVLALARSRGLLGKLLWGTDHPWGPLAAFRTRMDQLAGDATIWPDGQPLTPADWAGLMGENVLALLP